MIVKNIDSSNYHDVAKIYEQGIATGLATFATNIPTWQSWHSSHLPTCRLAAYDGCEMAGWAALTAVSSRCVYAGVAEVSVYVAANCRGKGVGTFLLQQLISKSEEAGYWTLQLGIFTQNKSSILLHKKCGFREVGYREKISNKDGTWLDNIIMERRSKIVGI